MRPRFASSFLVVAVILGGCHNNPIAAEQRAILESIDKSVDDLQPIEARVAGSVCDNMYSIIKLHYDEICGSYQKMGEARIGSSGNTRIGIRILALPTFGRPVSLRFELESSAKGTITVRQLSRDVLRDDLLPFPLGTQDILSSPFAQDVRMTYDSAAELDSVDVGKVLAALNQARLWGMEFDPFRSGWRYHFRGLLGDNLSSTLLQLVGLGTVIDCFDGTAWVIEALEADRWGAVMRICRPMGEGHGAPPLPLDDLGNTMIQIVRSKFPDLDLAARAERTSTTP